MNLGEAMSAIEAGHYVSRTGWAAGQRHGCYIFLMRPNELDGLVFRGFIMQRLPDQTFSPWQPTQEEVLATDWIDHGMFHLADELAWRKLWREEDRRAEEEQEKRDKSLRGLFGRN